ncbi:MAG: hypothetical protein FWE68_04265, partial [Defluviitaleaceae bacterium]|nr:hypothetical protein [Defluviitaleaceae bacterium]
KGSEILFLNLTFASITLLLHDLEYTVTNVLPVYHTFENLAKLLIGLLMKTPKKFEFLHFSH